MTAGFTPTVSK